MSEMNKKAGGGARRAWPLLVGLPLILAVAVAAVLLSGERPQPAGQPQQSAQKEQPSGSEREGARQNGAQLGHPALGDAKAPVIMVEYGDYQ